MIPTPINSCVLVELTESLDYVDMPDQKYGTKTSGVVIAIPNNEAELDFVNLSFLMGARVYFKDFADGSKIEVDDKQCAFIPYEDIRGYSE